MLDHLCRQEHSSATIRLLNLFVPLQAEYLYWYGSVREVKVRRKVGLYSGAGDNQKEEGSSVSWRLSQKEGQPHRQAELAGSGWLVNKGVIQRWN